MASKVDIFVTLAEAELSAIRAQTEQLALKAQVLSNRWAALGKTDMPGWLTYNWEGRPFTAAELATALNGLTVAFTDANATSLVNLNVAKPVDRIVKASL